MLNDRRGVSPVITTVIIVAVGITIEIAVALWMTGLVGAFMGYEKIEIRSTFANPQSGGGWEVIISYVNTGSSPAKIDNVFVNNIPYNQWTTITCDPDVKTNPAPANIGQEGQLKLTISKDATYSSQTLVSGVTVTIKLHSTGGKEYFTSVVLP
ncbi:MAG: archaellin/type IV pilin N-terminal domain-containing protein [Thermoproteota archaeon]